MKNPKDLLEDIEGDYYSKYDSESEPVPMESVDMEVETKKEVGEVLRLQREKEKSYEDKLDIETGVDFYFQIVFRSPKEMWQFLDSHKIKLHDDDFIFYEEIADKFIKE